MADASFGPSSGAGLPFPGEPGAQPALDKLQADATATALPNAEDFIHCRRELDIYQSPWGNDTTLEVAVIRGAMAHA